MARRRPIIQQPPIGTQINWSHPISQGMVACWLMNEGGGKTLYDLCGRYNAAITSTKSYRLQTIKGTVFDANNGNYASCGNVTSFDYNTPFSVSCWINQVSYASNNQVFVAKNSEVNPYPGWFLRTEQPTGRIYFVLENNVVTNCARVYAPANIVGVWRDIVATYDGSSKVSGMNIYVNSVKQTLTTEKDTLTASVLTTYPLCIGTSGPNSNNFNGKLANTQLWNRVLQPSEAMELYRNPYCFLQ